MLNSEPWILGGYEVHPLYTSLYIITWGGEKIGAYVGIADQGPISKAP
jgi:hypothetical protein